MEKTSLLVTLLVTVTISASEPKQNIYIRIQQSRTIENGIYHHKLSAIEIFGETPVSVTRSTEYVEEEICSDKYWLQGKKRRVPFHNYEGFENSQKIPATRAEELFHSLMAQTNS